MGDDPHAVPYRQCHSPSLNLIHATTSSSSSSSPHHELSSPSPPLAPFQQQHVAFAPVPSYSTSGLNVPLPPLRDSTSTTAFRLYEDHDHDLGDEGGLPLLRAVASTRSRESADAWSVQRSPRREEPTICAPIASRNVCHVGTKL